MTRVLRRRWLVLAAIVAGLITGVTRHEAAPRATAIEDAAWISSARVAEHEASPPSTSTSTTTATTATTTTATTSTAAPPRPQPAAAARPPQADLLARAQSALDSAVPAAWLGAVRPRLEIIAGATSWSSTTGVIRVARYHAGGPYARLQSILAHEWGHQAAYRYGTHEYLGAPPSDWPYSGSRPAEAWADCVAQVLTGVNPGRRAGACQEASLQFTRDWLARGPSQ